MKKRILEMQSELGLSLSKLSQLIGHHSNYLSRALRDGVSTAKQAEIIKKLDDLTSNMNADKEQYVSIRYHDQEITKLKNINTELFNDNSIKDFQINQFKKENLELKEIRDILVNERNELQQGLNRACEQLHKESQKMRIAENEFTALEASYKNALERERHLSDNYDYVLKEMAAAKHKELYWWVALLIVSVVVIALVAL